MTTIQQQIDFVQDLRDKWDNTQRERIQIDRDPQAVAELLRDVQENLIAMKLMQLGDKKIELCSDCNQPFGELNPKVVFGTDEKHVVVHPEDKDCERCTHARLDKLNNSTAGIP